MSIDEYASASTAATRSLLPEEMILKLENGIREGFRDLGVEGYLDRSNSNESESRKINDQMIPEFCEWLIKLDSKVRILGLNRNPITSAGASVLFDSLRLSNSSIKQINLHFNPQIDDKCMKSIGEYIKSNTSVEILRLSNNTISDAGIEILSPYFEGNTTLKQLFLDGNQQLTVASVPSMEKIIESSHIFYMDVSHTQITETYTLAISLACNNIKKGLSFLSINEKRLHDSDLIKVCNNMKKYGVEKLKEINLHNNDLTSKGATLLFDTLGGCNSTISYLNLSSNQLGDESMKSIGEYLQSDQHLKKLFISGNKITNNGVELLSSYLIGNITLQQLDLSCNLGISDVSAPYLIEMAKSSRISQMDLRQTHISEKKVIEIKELLRMPINYRDIPIKSFSKSAAKVS